MGTMRNKNLWIIGALVAAECGAFFFAGGAAQSALESCREEKAAVIDMGLSGMRYELFSGDRRISAEVVRSETAAALQGKLPASFTFLREGGRLVSGATVGALPFGKRSTDFQKGDLVYVPSTGRLVIFLEDGREAAGAVPVGKIGDVTAFGRGETEEIEISMGR